MSISDRPDSEALGLDHPDGSLPGELAPPARPALTLDVTLYEEYLRDVELTADQKREFLEALWSIIVAFVDLGFGIHPVQQAKDGAACGQKEKSCRNGGFGPASLSAGNHDIECTPNPAGRTSNDRAERKET